MELTRLAVSGREAKVTIDMLIFPGAWTKDVESWRYELSLARDRVWRITHKRLVAYS